MELYIYKITHDAPDAFYGSNEAACFDLSAYIPYQMTIKAYTTNNGLVDIVSAQDATGKNFIDLPAEWRALIPTGLIFNIPMNHSVRVYPRSGLSSKKGLNLINCVGIIDSDYTDEVFIPVYNNSQERLRIYSHDRIAQAEMVFNNRAIVNYMTTKPQPKSNRSGGFGSTGV